MSRFKTTIEATRLDEAAMVDSLVTLIEKQLEGAEKDYLLILRKLTVSLGSIKNTVRKDPRFGSDIEPDLRNAVLKMIGEGQYPEEMIDIVLHFFGKE